MLSIQLRYKLTLVIWLTGVIFDPIVSLAIWSSVSLSGWSYRMPNQPWLAGYFIAQMLVNHATFTWFFLDFDDRVRKGRFSEMLLKPVHPIHRDIVESISYKLLTLTVVAPTAVFLTIAFRPILSPTTPLLFLPVLCLACVLRFAIEWCLALTALWTTRIVAVNQAYILLFAVTSGYIAPITFLPHTLQAFANCLPFRWMLYFPIELLIRSPSPGYVACGIAAQLAWIIVGSALLKLIWKAGIRRYSAVGS